MRRVSEIVCAAACQTSIKLFLVVTARVTRIKNSSLVHCATRIATPSIAHRCEPSAVAARAHMQAALPPRPLAEARLRAARARCCHTRSRARRSTHVAYLCALTRLIMTDALEATPMEIAEPTSLAADGPDRTPSTSDPMELGCTTLSSAIPDASGKSVDSAAELHAQGLPQRPAAASSGAECAAGLPDTHVVTIQPLTRAIVNEEQVCVCTGPESARGCSTAIIAPDPKVIHVTCFLYADSVPVCVARRARALAISVTRSSFPSPPSLGLNRLHSKWRAPPRRCTRLGSRRTPHCLATVQRGARSRLSRVARLPWKSTL